jgi:chorismate mutase/prephenate dehydratase
MPEQGDDPVVRELRAAIDAADRDVLAALNRRIAAVRRLHDHKTANGYSLSDPSREAAIVVSLQEANEGPMADESVPAVVSAVLSLTLGEVRRLRGQGW